jgi:uncharacterized protein YdaL
VSAIRSRKGFGPGAHVGVAWPLGLAILFAVAQPEMAADSIGAPPAESPSSVAIVYDGPTESRAKAYLHALFLQDLLGHFNLRADLIQLSSYQPGELAGHRAGFFIGATERTQVPRPFLADVLASSQPFAWMGGHVGQLLQVVGASRQLGFTFKEYREDLGFTQVVYKDTVLSKGEPDLNIVSVTDPKAVDQVATAVNRDRVSHPYVLRNGRFWYFADSPFSYVAEGDRYLVICDLLHDILEIRHPADSRALVRIEDVSVEDDPDQLRTIADRLSARRIPFQIALIPVFKDPQQSLEVRLASNTPFVEAIHYMVAHGGTPIMHGVTHQLHGVSADDYELWDPAADRPVAGDSTNATLARLHFGIAECFANGIFPIAFETPHYSASQADYLAIGRVFSLSYDRVMAAPHLDSAQFFPYAVVDRYGRNIVPEDLGFIPAGQRDVKPLLEAARGLRVVRDGIASFYFHPFLDPVLLDRLVAGISQMGYRFVSLREFGGTVDSQDRYVIRTASGTARISPRNEYWRLRLFDAGGSLIGTGYSASRSTGPAHVAVQVPPGGWAALDCVLAIPRDARPRPAWTARLKEWWDGLHFTSLGRPENQAHDFPPGKSAWLLWLDDAPVAAARDQESYRSVLQTFGYGLRLVTLRLFSRAPERNDTILIVPQAAAARLTDAQQREVLRYLAGGGQIITEGHPPWLERLGFQFTGDEETISSVSDQEFPEMPLVWRPARQVERFIPPDSARELMAASESGQALALSGGFGFGRYLHLAVPLDTQTSDGTSSYPYFPQYLSETFGPATPLRSSRIEAYFDPSYRPGASFNRLAGEWHDSGIRTIYVAAWQFTRKFSFPYDEFIHACHRHGVSVYAWFVLPAVTEKMWADHPEWREKTATGADGRVEWRYAMNLQNPACFRAAMDWVKDLLSSNDWDGVNITELNYGAADQDWLRPEVFVPMNDDVRAGFRARAGFDPIALFRAGSPYYLKTNPGALEKFLRYRQDIVLDWHRRVLSEIEPLRKHRGWEVIVTALDSLHSDYVRRALGVDSRRIVGLMQEFPFTLQVEDPTQFWAGPPDRYRRFAEAYLKLVRDPRRLMFDVNVLAERDVSRTFLPSATATGMELARTVAAAGSVSGRVAIYSEHTVPRQDWPLLRNALAQTATLSAGPGGWQVRSPVPVLLGPAAESNYYVDGALWPAVSADGVLTPAGRHTVSTDPRWWHIIDPGALPARIVSCTADLEEARAGPTGLLFRYASPGRAVILFNQRPREIVVDGKPADLAVEQSEANWSAVFPAGEHRVTVATNTRAGIAVEEWGWASASLIAAVGGIATIMMAGIYLQIRVRRLARRRG